MREDLYLVTETVETARQETLKSEQKYAFWSRLDFYSLKYEHKVRILGRSRGSSLGPPTVGGDNASPDSRLLLTPWPSHIFSCPRMCVWHCEVPPLVLYGDALFSSAS